MAIAPIPQNHTREVETYWSEAARSTALVRHLASTVESSHWSQRGRIDKITPPSMMVIPQIVRWEGKTDTLDAIDKGHELINTPLSDFPGVTFDATIAHDRFLGLLGTAHGSGPGFFLVQHKAWFGIMEIKSIQVWAKPAVKPIYHITFSIVPVATKSNESSS